MGLNRDVIAPMTSTADYIVVGGGWAGCIVAALLSENPRSRVLMLEAGGENTHEHSYYGSGVHGMWGKETNWDFFSTPQAELGGRTINHPRGKVIGGSAAINLGSWSRGIADDYDAWEQAGASGWGWQGALDTFRRAEASTRPDDGTRGRNGPLRFEDAPVGSEMTTLFREACIAAGIGVTDDHNGTKFEGFDRWETIFPNGRRHNSAEAYLGTAVRSRKNLEVITGAFVSKVVIENGRAIGVEYEIGIERRRAAASREVVLCAGALQSPQLLMLSGIGPADHLRALDINVVADLPGVGVNLIDHPNFFIGAAAASGGIAPVKPDADDPAQLEKWRHTGYGPLSVIQNPAIAFVRSNPDLTHPDIELLFHISPPADLVKDAKTGGFSILVANVDPKSRGEIRLASADPHVSPLIDFRYFSHPEDLSAMIAGTRVAIKIGEAKPLAGYTARRSYNPEASDAEIGASIRSTSQSMFHPVGTARMGAVDDPMGVLDPQLRVRGIEGLRVMDASSMPGIVRGHTMAPVLYIAERGCELIRTAAD
jgi:choline dehydrogenase